MSDFNLRLNAPNSVEPQTMLGAFTALPRPLAVFMGPTSKEREGEREGKE